MDAPNGQHAKTPAQSAMFAAAVLAALLVTVPVAPPHERVFAAAWAGFCALCGFFIIRTGKVSPWRAVFFITLAAAFILRHKLGLGGPGKAPYCHIAMSANALDFVYQQQLAFSGGWKMWGPLTLGGLWLAATLVLGQAWCSWACFYGGLDEGFSRLLPERWRPLRLKIPPPLRDIPAALLILWLLASLAAMYPLFCLWGCPLKMTCGFAETGMAGKIQNAAMIILGVVFIVILPVLSGKRSFCGLICPFGAWQSFFGRINPFRVSRDENSCAGCGQCGQTCPVLAIEAAGGKPAITSYCNRCGRCIDECPHGAISYTVLGRKPPVDARALLVFCGLAVGGALGSLFVPGALYGLWRLILR